MKSGTLEHAQIDAEEIVAATGFTNITNHFNKQSMDKHKENARRVILLFSCVILTAFTSEFDSITTIQVFKEVVIGNQTWMEQNLNLDTFRNGDVIPQARTVKEWTEAARNKKPAWCYFNNDSTLGSKYGKLYNFFAVSDPRGLAPEGWRIPKESDWVQLVDFLGGKAIAGSKMKSTSDWEKNGNGTNESGFSALAGGSRELSLIKKTQGFLGMGSLGYWWSTNYDKRTQSIWVVSLNQSNGKLFSTFESSRGDGYSVRCIRN